MILCKIKTWKCKQKLNQAVVTPCSIVGASLAGPSVGFPVEAREGVHALSQVPQPTCYWKWVGVSMPLRADNFSLRPSSTAILQDSMLSGCLLSPYGSQVALTPTTKFHIHPVLLQSSIYITLPILTSHPPNPHFVSDMFLDSISHFYLQSYF